MNIEKELENLLKNYKIQKKLDNIENLLIKNHLDNNSNFWIFPFLLMLFTYGGFGIPEIPDNCYKTEKEEENVKSNAITESV